MSKAELSRAVAFLEAGDWRAAHEIVQRDENSALSCWAHGIVHLMEGDRSNAGYWYRRAKRKLASNVSIPQEIDTLKAALVEQENDRSTD